MQNAEPPGSSDRVWQHRDLAAGRWFKLDLVEQLANVGSEVERTISWREKGDVGRSQRSFERALELMDLTLADPKNRGRRKEPCRARELLADYFAGDNQYGSSDALWRRYFLGFAWATQLGRTRARGRA
jgi:hypothetical protein